MCSSRRIYCAHVNKIICSANKNNKLRCHNINTNSWLGTPSPHTHIHTHSLSSVCESDKEKTNHLRRHPYHCLGLALQWPRPCTSEIHIQAQIQINMHVQKMRRRDDTWFSQTDSPPVPLPNSVQFRSVYFHFESTKKNGEQKYYLDDDLIKLI